MAAAESANDRSKRDQRIEDRHSERPTSPNARHVSGRRASTCASSAALVIHAARIAEPLPPARSA